MKQKIVIKVHVKCDKCRTKALKVAAAADCVISVALEGEDKDQVVVIGDGVDAASLVCSLRKKVGYAYLVSVEEVKVKVEVEEKVKVEVEVKVEEKRGEDAICYQPHCELLYKVVYEPYPSDCTVM